MVALVTFYRDLEVLFVFFWNDLRLRQSLNGSVESLTHSQLASEYCFIKVTQKVIHFFLPNLNLILFYKNHMFRRRQLKYLYLFLVKAIS